MQKKVKLISKTRAKKVFDALLKQGKTPRMWKYSNGKYNPDTTVTGKETKINVDTYCVYRELRCDNDGKYARVMCVTAD